MAELRERRLAARVAPRPLGRVASRRAMAGLETGGAVAKRVRRLARGLVGRTGAHAADRGQALLMVLGAAFAILFAASLLVALGGALTGHGPGAARAWTWSRSPAHARCETTSRGCSRRRAFPAERRTRVIWTSASTWHERRRRRARPPPETASIPTGCDSRSPTPTRSRRFACGPRSSRRSTGAPFRGSVGSRPGAHRPPAAPSGSRPAPRPWRRRLSPASTGGARATATGGGYSGPLAYRQGKGMRPDVAVAFDRLAAAARRARDLAGDHLGVSLRRRAGAPVRRASRPPVGRAAGPIASPVRDRARPRAVVRVPVAGRERVAASAS